MLFPKLTGVTMTNAKKLGKSTEKRDILIISINRLALELRYSLIMYSDLVKPYMVTVFIFIKFSILVNSLCKKH